MHPITRRRFFDLTAKTTLGLGAARFEEVVNGKALRADLSGIEFRRVET